MNMPTDQSCFKCAAPLHVTSRIDSTQQPYFPPATHGMPSIWRTQSTLVMTKEASLPDRCIKCNAYTDQRLKRKLTWHHPALYLLIFASLLIYLIVAMVVRKKARIDVGLCAEHKAARKRSIAITWSLGLLSIGSFVMAAMLEDFTFIVASLAFLVATIIYGIVTLRIVAPTKIDEHYVWLKGANPEYLQEFPELSGAR